jgi:osmoprotectant transport system ATP-binding protein
MASNAEPRREPTASSDGAAALSAIGVTKHFGRTVALDGVNLSVTEGECLALVGESGSGKSTLLRCFNRLVEPDAGTIVVAGRDIASVDPVELRRSIGYVQQDGGLLPHWRVGRNVELVIRLLPAREDTQHRADEVLRLVGLEPVTFRNRWPRELSGGQRQRVALARALAARPWLLLLDEPFGALDAISRADIQESFIRLRSSLSGTALTSVFVTHDLHEAFLLADRIAVLRRGRLEQVGPPQELLTTPASNYVRELLVRARVTEVAPPVAKREALP